MTNRNSIPNPDGVEVRGEVTAQFAEILTPDALAFVAKLQRAFGARRLESLTRRQTRQAALDHGEPLDFLPDTKHIRESDWACASIPPDLRDRRVEITGPTDRKMVINALNSGAKMFMLVFTLPSYDVVFKLIRDRFEAPKESDRSDVMRGYRMVFEHECQPGDPRRRPTHLADPGSQV